MPSLLQEFDILLFPSIWVEPFGRIILEGMISGLIVVATAKGGPSEIVVDGKNGLLFPPGDSEVLAEKIAALAADPELRWRLAQAGRQTVTQRFTSTDMLDKIEDYLEEVAFLSNVESTNEEDLHLNRQHAVFET
jgi:glycosyltransferase involved in cell wall biosynthesis